MSDAVTVRNKHSRALDLRLYKRSQDEFGYNVTVRDGDPVTLRPGDNLGVDKAFIDAWLEQNKRSNLVNYVEVDRGEEQSQGKSVE